MVRKVRPKQNGGIVKGKGFIYIPHHKLVYARVPKCANTSIKTALSELIQAVPTTNPRTERALEPTNDRFWKNCTTEAKFLKPDKYTALRKKVFCFTFIREPLQRLHSCYREKVLRPSVFPAMKRLGYDKTMSFSEFVELTCSLSLDAMDVHTQPQTFLISDSKGKLPDFIGCIESMRTDWQRLNEQMLHRDIPISRELPHLNSSRKGESNQSQSIRLLERVQRQFEMTYGLDIQLHQKLTAAQLP
jgi:hypothetical protein